MSSLQFVGGKIYNYQGYHLDELTLEVSSA